MDNHIEVLARSQAPNAPEGHEGKRPPQVLALVIDRSGSMAGRPLEEAKRYAEYVLGKLCRMDAVAMVKFDNRVQRLWPAVPLGDGVPQRAAIAGIQTCGNEWAVTMLEAMRSIAASRERVCAMKEMMNSSGKLRSLLTAIDEDVQLCASEAMSAPAYLRRKPSQGKGQI